MLLLMKEVLNTITLPPNYVAYDERGVKPYHLNMLLMMRRSTPYLGGRVMVFNASFIINNICRFIGVTTNTVSLYFYLG